MEPKQTVFNVIFSSLFQDQLAIKTTSCMSHWWSYYWNFIVYPESRWPVNKDHTNSSLNYTLYHNHPQYTTVRNVTMMPWILKRVGLEQLVERLTR